MSIAVGNLNDLINVATNSKAIVSNLACVTIASRFSSSRNLQDRRKEQKKPVRNQQGNL